MQSIILNVSVSLLMPPDMKKGLIRVLRIILLISAVSLICAVTLFHHYNIGFSEALSASFVEDERVPLSKSFGELQKCVLQTDSLWDDLVDKVEKCQQNSMNNTKSVEFMKLKVGRYDEFKVFLPFSSGFNTQKDNCNYVTVGIGGDITAEKHFHQLYPNCQIYGLEPKIDQAANFSSIGKFIPYGLSVKGDVMNLTVEIEKLSTFSHLHAYYLVYY